jgi:hypothetical protein
MKSPRIPALIAAFVAGLVFALGLGLAGMAQPAKVLGFLDFFGRWDPSLLFVMIGALVVHMPFVAWLRRRRPGVVTSPAPLDRQLVLGAAIFGVGWGFSGLCPGPAFVALAGGNLAVVLFVGGLFAGTGLVVRQRGAPPALAPRHMGGSRAGPATHGRGARRRRHARQRRGGAELLGARRPRRQPGLPVYLADP